MSTEALTIFGMVLGHPMFRHQIDPRVLSPRGLESCRELLENLAGGADAVDLPFPLVDDSAQRLKWGVPFRDELDDTCRAAFERVEQGWPGHVFTVFDVRQAANRRLAQGVVMPYDSFNDVLGMMSAGETGERLASGLLIPADESPEAEDAFGELAQVMLTAALMQRTMHPAQGHAPKIEPFTAAAILDARPALLLDVERVDSEEFAGRLISFAGHYSMALLDQ